MSLPPGPPRSALRQTVEYVRRPLGFVEDCAQRYGDPFTFRVVQGDPIVVMSDPETIRTVFTADPDLLRSGEANALLQAALGRRSLVLLDGAEHLRERKLMLPPFHGERMRRYGELIAEIAEREVATWPQRTPFRTDDRMRRLSLEVILRAVLGVEEPDRLARLERTVQRMLDANTRPHRMLVLLLIRPGGPTMRTWRRYAIRHVDGLLHAEIDRRRADPREDILSLLLQARDDQDRPMSDEHARDELMTLLVAGHETTATALAWALERLARHPAVVERLAADGDEDYLDAVVKETLRVRTIVPFVVRQLAAPAEIAGHALPAGWRVAPCGHLVHRRPDIYPEPEAFRPERFLDQRPDSYAWIPFGGGTRRCIGAAFATLEMKAVLRAVARSGRISAPEPDDEPPLRRGVTLTPARGARIVWERR